MNSKRGISKNIKSNQSDSNDPNISSPSLKNKAAPSDKPNSSPNTQYPPNQIKLSNNDKIVEKHNPQPKDVHTINIGGKGIHVESVVDPVKPDSNKNTAKNFGASATKNNRNSNVNRNLNKNSFNKISSDFKQKCETLDNTLKKFVTNRFATSFEAILWISEHDAQNSNFYVGKTYKTGKVIVQANTTKNFNEIHKTPEKLILKPLGVHYTDNDSETSISPSRKSCFKSNKSKNTTLTMKLELSLGKEKISELTSNYTINRDSNYLQVGDNTEDKNILVSALDTIRDSTDFSRRKNNIRNKSISRSELNFNIHKSPDLNMGSDYEYDEESFVEEDQPIKISVKFRNKSLEKKISALEETARDIKDLEKEMDSKRKKLEANENGLKLKESQCNKKSENLEKKESELEEQHRESEKLRKNFEKRERDIKNKNREVDRLDNTIKTKTETLLKETENLKQREVFVKNELTKDKEKQKIVDTKEKQIKEVNQKLEKKNLELKKIEDSWKDKENKLEKQYEVKIQKNEDKVNDLNSKYNQVDLQVKQTNKLLSDKKEEISNLESQVEELDGQVSSTDRFQEKKSEEATKKTKAIEKLNQDLKNMNSQVYKLNSQQKVIKKIGSKQICSYITNKILMNLLLPSFDKMIANRREYIKNWILENNDIVEEKNKQLQSEKLKTICVKNDLKLMAKTFSQFNFTSKTQKTKDQLEEQQRENNFSKQKIDDLKSQLTGDNLEDELKWRMFAVIIKVSEQKHFIVRDKLKRQALDILKKFCLSQISKFANPVLMSANMNYTMGGYLLSVATKRVIIEGLQDSFECICRRSTENVNFKKNQKSQNIESEHTEEFGFTENISFSKKPYETPLNTKYDLPTNTDQSFFKLEDTNLNSEICKKENYAIESSYDGMNHVKEKIALLGDFTDCSPNNLICDTLKYSTSPDREKIMFDKKDANKVKLQLKESNENISIKPSPSENNINSTSKKTSVSVSGNLINIKSEENLHTESFKTPSYNENRTNSNEQNSNTSNLEQDVNYNSGLFKKDKNEMLEDGICSEKNQEKLNKDFSKNSLVSQKNSNRESNSRQNETNSSMFEESFLRDVQSPLYKSPTIRKKPKQDPGEFKVEIKNEDDESSLGTSRTENRDFETNLEKEIISRVQKDIDERNLDEELNNELRVLARSENNKGFMASIFSKFSNLCSCKKEKQQQDFPSYTSLSQTCTETSSQNEIRSQTQTYSSSYTANSYTSHSKSYESSQMTSLQEIQDSHKTLSKLEVILEEDQTYKEQSSLIKNEDQKE